MMKTDDVLLALAAVAEVPAPVWVAGGWGVDALLGRISRDHRDLDLVMSEDLVAGAASKLAMLGYARDAQTADGRIVFRADDGRKIDVTTVVFDTDGAARAVTAVPGTDAAIYPAAGFVTGSIDGETVCCLSAAVQLERHTGYLPDDHDCLDVALLVTTFGLEPPVGYR